MAPVSRSRGLRRARRIARFTACAMAVLGLGGVAYASSRECERTVLEAGTAPPSVLIIMDASASMAKPAGGGQTRLQAAKAALRTLVDGLPDDARVGLRLYGHSVSGAGRTAGCRDTELVAPVGRLDRARLTARIAAYEAVGSTPIGRALRDGAHDLPADGATSIVLVSDGGDNCAPPSPCAVAEQIAAEGTRVSIQAIGFQVTPRARSALRCIADRGRGIYRDAGDADELAVALRVLAARATRSYEPQGTAISGGTSRRTARAIGSGRHVDRIAVDGERWYAVELGQRPAARGRGDPRARMPARARVHRSDRHVAGAQRLPAGLVGAERDLGHREPVLRRQLGRERRHLDAARRSGRGCDQRLRQTRTPSGARVPERQRERVARDRARRLDAAAARDERHRHARPRCSRAAAGAMARCCSRRSRSPGSSARRQPSSPARAAEAADDASRCGHGAARRDRRRPARDRSRHPAGRGRSGGHGRRDVRRGSAPRPGDVHRHAASARDALLRGPAVRGRAAHGPGRRRCQRRQSQPWHLRGGGRVLAGRLSPRCISASHATADSTPTTGTARPTAPGSSDRGCCRHGRPMRARSKAPPTGPAPACTTWRPSSRARTRRWWSSR